MNKEEWLNTFKEKQGKEISRLLFITFTDQEDITSKFNPKAYQRNKKKNPNKPYVLPIVNHYFQLWEEEGFLEKSRPLREILKYNLVIPNGFKEKYGKKLRYLPKGFALSILSLEPIYRYCKDFKQIEFTDPEKSYLKLLLLSEEIREAVRKTIINEYPEEDIIKATLMFYVKNCIIRYYDLLKDINENPKKYEKEKARAEEINNPTLESMQFQVNKWANKINKELHKKYAPNQPYRKIDFNIIKIVAQNISSNITQEFSAFQKKNKIELFTHVLIKPINEIKALENKQKEKVKLSILRMRNNLTHLFLNYLREIETNKKLVTSTDNKILMALNLQPSI